MSQARKANFGSSFKDTVVKDTVDSNLFENIKNIKRNRNMSVRAPALQGLSENKRQNSIIVGPSGANNNLSLVKRDSIDLASNLNMDGVSIGRLAKKYKDFDKMSTTQSYFNYRIDTGELVNVSDIIGREEQEKFMLMSSRFGKNKPKVDIDDTLNKILSDGRTKNYTSELEGSKCKKKVPTLQQRGAFSNIFEKRGDFNQAKMATINRIRKR